MCGRYSLAADLEQLALRFDFDPSGLDYGPRYNIAPTQPALTVTNREGRRAEFMRWGLIPSWAADASVGSRMINARGETVGQKPSFRDALRQRRCLVLADGFYEWRKAGNAKRPMRVVLKSRQPFAFAGLWDSWRDTSGDTIQSCTIITTEANSLLRPIHHRMPVILPPELEDFWLNHDITEPAMLCDALASYPDKLLEFYPVSPLMNKANNDGPELTAPAAGMFTEVMTSEPDWPGLAPKLPSR